MDVCVFFYAHICFLTPTNIIEPIFFALFCAKTPTFIVEPKKKKTESRKEFPVFCLMYYDQDQRIIFCRYVIG
ncbi:BH1184 [Halalkalibacterium halodurans C-125]|uniref:BH1184 protein n=1 Tax=Halalkalibacterium halodurans (strain ATCC BAA-125 / DSM 18197 / FERM 7344 / JCM 9153 / C-125) TaxID=272558 RepID=Q9KDM8_HALH5|nr:BH1184 [Halalkalibacterium halodurans C-125]